ncbi:hypothetical protein QQM79_03445 [Marinobacteraceae bacterium S3BR75-40.1]
MFRWIVPALLVLATTLAQGGGTGVPNVDGRVMEVGVSRYQGTLWRFVRFNTETDYPCLRFEALDPDNDWRVRTGRDVCGIELPDGEVLDFRNTAYTGFPSVAFNREQGAFEFQVEYMRRTAPGEQVVACRLPITKDGRLGPVACQ